MAAKKKSNAGLYVGGGLAVATLIGFGALLFLGGDAEAEEAKPEPPKPEPPKPEPKPEPEPEPEPKPDIIPLPGNWGVTPPAMRAAFEKTEEAAGIPGLGRFLAIWSWGAFRAKKPPVGAEEAAAIAEANPQLCRLCHNDSASERAASLTALNRVIQPKPLGAYDKPWPKPADVEGWSDGSYGLFDVLAGAHAHAGYHDGHFAPLIDHPATILYRVDVQCYIAGVMVQRIINNPTLLVLVDDDPLQTWANVRACTSTPQGFIDLLKGKDTGAAKAAEQARDNFFMRAIELGIDAAGLAMPFDKKKDPHWGWPGAPAFFNALGVDL